MLKGLGEKNTGENGSVVIDRSGLIYCSEQDAAELLGMPRSQLLGRNLSDFVESFDRNLFNYYLEKCFEIRKNAVCALKLVTVRGVVIPVQMTASCVHRTDDCRPLLSVSIIVRSAAFRPARPVEVFS